MSIDEARRRELWNSLRDTIGATQADTLMTMLPARPLPELATRQDMTALRDALRAEIRSEGNAVRADLRKDMADLRSEFGELRAELRADVGSLRSEIEAEGNAVRADLRKDMAELRSEFGDLRGEVGQLEGRLMAELARQTLTLGLTLGSLIIAVLGTMLTLGFTGAFA